MGEERGSQLPVTGGLAADGALTLLQFLVTIHFFLWKEGREWRRCGVKGGEWGILRCIEGHDLYFFFCSLENKVQTSRYLYKYYK